MLDRWYFCCALRLGAEETSTALAIIDALDDPGADDPTVVNALAMLAEAEQGLKLYAVDAVLRTQAERPGKIDISRAVKSLLNDLHGGLDPELGQLADAVVGGDGEAIPFLTNRFLRRLRTGLSTLPPGSREEVPYGEIEVHATTQLTTALLWAALGAGLVTAGDIDQDDLGWLVDECRSGDRGRAAFLSGLRLGEELGTPPEELLDSMWARPADRSPSVEPDLLRASAELLFPPAHATFDTLMTEVLTWPWLARCAHLSEFEIQPDVLLPFGDSLPLRVTLWQQTLLQHAAATWPDELARHLETSWLWRPVDARLPFQGVLYVHRRARADWQRTVEELLAGRGRVTKETKQWKGDPHALVEPWVPFVWSPWLRREGSRLDVRRDPEPLFQRPAPVLLLRALGSGMTAVTLMRRSEWRPAVATFALHLFDFLTDAIATPGAKHEAEELTTGSVGGLVDRLRRSVNFMGEGHDERSSPRLLVDLFGAGRPERPKSDAHAAVLGAVGIHVVAGWAAIALATTLKGDPQPWRDGDPPLAERFLHEVVSSDLPAVARQDAAVALRVFAPELHFDITPWDWQVAGRTKTRGKLRGWKQNWRAFVLADEELDATDWVKPDWEPLGRDRDLPGPLSLAAARAASVLAQPMSLAPAQEWLDELRFLCRCVAHPVDVPRILRRRLSMMVERFGDRAMPEGLRTDRDAVLDEVVRTIVQFGSGSPADVREVARIVEHSAQPHLHLAFLRAAAFTGGRLRNVQEPRIEGNLRLADATVDRSRASLLRTRGDERDPTSMLTASALALEWWQVGATAGRHRGAKLLDADLIGAGDADLRGLLALGANDAGAVQAVLEPAGPPRDGARRIAEVIETVLEGRRRLTVRVDGEELALDPQVGEGWLRRWSPDLSRAFAGGDPSERSWAVAVERRDGIWLPVDAGLVELVAALRQTPDDNTLTLVDPVGETDWRFVRRPGESFVLPRDAFADSWQLAELDSGAFGLRLQVHVDEHDGEVVLRSSGADGHDQFDRRNLLWAEPPDETVIIEQRPGEGWVWPRSVPGFPNVRVEGVFRGDREEVRLGAWEVTQQRRARITAEAVESKGVRDPSAPAEDVFEVLTALRRGTVLELTSIRPSPTMLESMGWTRHNVGVLVESESVSPAGFAAHYAPTRGRTVVVTGIEEHGPHVIEAGVDVPPGTRGVFVSTPRREGALATVWFRLGSSLVARTLEIPDRGRDTARPGDPVIVDADRQLSYSRRLIHSVALWEVRRERSAPRRALYLGTASVEDQLTSIFLARDQGCLVLTEPISRPLTHLEPSAGGTAPEVIGATCSSFTGRAKRWRAELADGTVLTAYGPDQRGAGEVSDVRVRLEKDHGGWRLTRTFGVAVRATVDRSTDRRRAGWDEYCVKARPLSGSINKGGSHVTLDELSVPNGLDWTKSVPLAAGESPWVPGAPYAKAHARVMIDIEAQPVVAFYHDIPPRTLESFVEASELRIGRVQPLARPLYFVGEQGDGNESRLLFERGFGDTILIPRTQVRLDRGPLPALLPLFHGDCITEATISESDGLILFDFRPEHVKYSFARTLYRQAQDHQVVHLIETEEGRVLAIHGLDLERVPSARNEFDLTTRFVVSEATVAGVKRERQRRTHFARMDTGRFESSGGADVVFNKVTPTFDDDAVPAGSEGLREGDVVLLVAGVVKRVGEEHILECHAPAEVTDAGPLGVVGVSRRRFSVRRGLLSRLAMLEPRSRRLEGSRLPVRIRKPSHRVEGSLTTLPARPSWVLRGAVALDSTTTAVVAAIDDRGVTLELQVGVRVRLAAHEVAGGVEDLKPGAVVKMSVAENGTFRVRQTVRSEREFLADGRMVTVLPASPLLNDREAPTLTWDHERAFFTAVGFPDTILRAASEQDFAALMARPHPRFATVEDGRLLHAVTPPLWRLGIDENDQPTATGVDGQVLAGLSWASLTFTDGSPASISRRVRTTEWRYHDEHTGHWQDGDPNHVKVEELGTRRFRGETVVLDDGLAPTRGRALPRTAFPSGVLLDDADRGSQRRLIVAGSVSDGSVGPVGLYVELSPGRVVHLPLALLSTAGGLGRRSLDRWDLATIAPGDEITVTVRSASETAEPSIDLFEWKPSVRGAWGSRRVLLPVAAAKGGTWSRLGAGRYVVDHPAVVDTDLAWLEPSNRCVAACLEEVASGDVVLLIADETGAYGVAGLGGVGARRADVEDRQRWLARVLDDPQRGCSLIRRCGGALPVTFEGLEAGVVEFSLRNQPPDRLRDGCIAFARILGLIEDRVLFAVGGRVVQGRVDRFARDLPPYARSACLEAMTAKGRMLVLRQRSGDLLSGFADLEDGAAAALRPSDLIDCGTDGAGLLTFERDDRSLQWLDADELGWVDLSDDERSQVVESWRGTVIDTRWRGGRPTFASRFEQRFHSLRPGTVARVRPLVSTQRDGASWTTIGMLSEACLVRVSGIGDPPVPGQSLLAEVDARHTTPRRTVSFVRRGERPPVWDVPPALTTWLRDPVVQNRWQAVVTGVVPHVAGERDLELDQQLVAEVGQARHEHSPAASSVLDEWLRRWGWDLVFPSVESTIFEAAPVIAALDLLADRARHEEKDKVLLDLLMWSVGMRAARSVHLEALAGAWRHAELDNPLWFRLRRPLRPRDGEVDHGVLAHWRVDRLRHEATAIRSGLAQSGPDEQLDVALSAISFASGGLDDDADASALLDHAPVCRPLVESLWARRGDGDGSVPVSSTRNSIEAALDAAVRAPYPCYLISPGVALSREFAERAREALQRVLHQG